MSDNFHHRAKLTQKNKPFKSKFSSKGALKRAAGENLHTNFYQCKGKVETVRNAGKLTALKKKEERLNFANQQRKNKLQKQIDKKRSFATGEAPPKVVGVIPLGEVENIEDYFRNIQKEGSHVEKIEEMQEIPNFTFYTSRWKTRLSFYLPTRDINPILDIGKVSEVIYLVIPKTGIDERGKLHLRILQSQGCGSIVLGIMTSNDKSAFKSMKKKLIDEYFPDIAKSLKCVEAENVSEVVRAIAQIHSEEAPISRYTPRPFLLSNQQPIVSKTADGKNSLEVYGYVRGGQFDVNHLVHIPDYGDFQITSITSCDDICPISKHHGNDEMMTDIITRIADDARRESLQSENVPDPLEGEQNLGDEDDEAMDHSKLFNATKKVKIPKGSSIYQAAWILEDDDENGGDAEGDNHDGDETKVDDGENEEMHGDDDDDHHSNNTSEAATSTDHGGDDDEEEEYEELTLEQLRKRQQEEDMMFPDEVDTPEDIPARERYQKYRGLKSFRTSPWDSKENLPRNYSRIFQFRSYLRTAKRVMYDVNSDDCVPIGKFVKIVIENVPDEISNHPTSHPLIVFGLFPYEQKTSVVNFTLQRNIDYHDTIESKDPLIFYCGIRRLRVRPIFSEHTMKIDKHKFEKFFHPSSTIVATIYGPIMFPPSSLLVFKEKQNGSLEYIAKGSLLNVDPDRLIIKKITLSGHPIRITKKRAIVRKMFYNPEDVAWFKPVEIRTKLGRTGHILCSMGTHGYMKCQFDRQLQPNDTVLMNLYKRVYPPWKASLYSRYLPHPHHSS